MKTIQTIFLGLAIVVLIGCFCAERCKSVGTYQQMPTHTHSKDEPVQQPIYSKTYRVTAYCLCEKCCGKWSKVYPRRTANGHIIKPGDKFAAADKSISFGTKLDIPGYGIVQVLDRGGAIKGNRLDVFFPTHQEALNWGVKHLMVKEIHHEKHNSFFASTHFYFKDHIHFIG